jgi:dTDP-3-amino-3,4,6-trideoxy-alpha-D-glucose transaminase
MILLNDFQRQWADTRAEVLAATERVGESGWYILGKSVERFERALAASFERGFAVGCASGLDAIELGLRALGVRAGDKVLTTPLSAFATTLAIVRAGGVPVFVDVDERGLIDLARCEERLAAGDIRAFVPVHLYGQPLDLAALSALQARFGLALVEDCAQSALARFGGRGAGTVGAIAATSFYPTKNLGALGDAGALVTDDPALRDRCASLRNYGQTARYQHDELGLNSRLDELQAAILEQAFLPRLPAWTERRRAVAQRYLAGIRHPRLRLPVPAPGAEPCWHLFPVFVPAAERDGFQRHLQAAGVQTAIHYPTLIVEQRALTEGARHEIHGSLDNARRLSRQEVSLPIHPYLLDSELDTIVAAVNAWTP